MMAVGLWKRCRVVIAVGIFFPTHGRSIPGTAESWNVSAPGRRHGNGRRFAPIRITGPTRSDAGRTGARLILITGRHTGRNMLIRQGAIGISRGFGTQDAAAGGEAIRRV